MNASPSAEEETEVRNGGEYLGIIDVIWIVTFFKFLRRIEDVTDYSLHCQYTLGNVWQQWTVDSWASHSLNIQVFLSHALAKNVIQLFSGCAQLRSNIIYLNGNIHIQGHFSSLFFDETLTVCTNTKQILRLRTIYIFQRHKKNAGGVMNGSKEVSQPGRWDKECQEPHI